MATDSLIALIKKVDVQKVIAEYLETRFGTRQKNHDKICWIKSKTL